MLGYLYHEGKGVKEEWGGPGGCGPYCCTNRSEVMLWGSSFETAFQEAM